MNKEKATRALAKELGNLERTVVIEDSYKNSLVKNASSAYQVGDPLVLTFYDNKFHSGKDRKSKVSEIMLSHDSSFIEANYFFMTSIPSSKIGRPDFMVTPYALIGEKEKNSLKKLFYKDINPEILDAMKTVGAENFASLYEQYSHDGSPFNKMLKDIKSIKDLISGAEDLESDEYGYVSKESFSSWGGIDCLNSKLKKIGADALLTPDFDGAVHEDVVSEVIDDLSDLLKNIKRRYWDPLLSEFIDIVFFSLSYEEQNVDVNKKFLREYTDLGFVTNVLLKEYSKGKHFQEYFSSLKKEVQNEVVGILKNIPRNPLYDHFLWYKGFKDFKLDIRILYKESSGDFIKYFKDKNVEEKKVILKDIMDYEFTNEKVAKFLNKKYLDLVREVGLNE